MVLSIHAFEFSKTETERIALIAEGKLNSIFSQKSEPQLRSLLLHSRLLTRITDEIDSYDDASWDGVDEGEQNIVEVECTAAPGAIERHALALQ